MWAWTWVWVKMWARVGEEKSAGQREDERGLPYLGLGPGLGRALQVSAEMVPADWARLGCAHCCVHVTSTRATVLMSLRM